ncbi:ChaN family lipoprotein [Flavobacteriales bacterium]|nr:ChaN family lipoprotein [Flavobacteriales bacterium]
MRKLLLFSLLNFFIFTNTYAQEIAFQIYNADGNRTSYRMMSYNAEKADVILFGENHKDPISHWLQLELTKSLFEKHGENLMLGAEMIESDNQVVLDEYLLGFIREKDFEKEAKIWPNHKTDYRPLLSFAKDNNLYFVATNIPRRFANMVYRFGVDTLNYLPEVSKQFIAPLPITYDTSLHCYKEISVMAEGHGGENLPKSQAIKDATMAYFIHKNMKGNTKFLHYNGSYHSRFHESIMWYLLQLNPDLDILTIEVLEQEDISEFDEELIGNADYFIVVDEDMCKTH